METQNFSHFIRCSFDTAQSKKTKTGPWMPRRGTQQLHTYC